MDILFIVKVIISFFIAGVWIASATIFAERLGSKVGGLIANLPSNILISLVFIALVNGTSYVVNAVPSIPIGMTINTLFLFIFIIILSYGLIRSIIISLFAWLGVALCASLFHYDNLLVNLVCYVIITGCAFVVLEKVYKIPSVTRSNKTYTRRQIIWRAIFAGSVVSSVIIISKFLSPYIVGILATFPAVLLSTMVILTVNQTKAFAQATGKVLVLSSSNIVIYGLAVYFTYPEFGIALGTIISFLIALLWVWFFRPIVRRLT